MLEMSPYLVLFTAVIFIIMLVFLNKTLYKPMLLFVDGRKNSIKEDQEITNKNIEKTAAIEEEIRQIILKAKTDAAKIKAEVVQKTQKEAQTAIDAKKTELEQEYKEFEKTMENERMELKNGLFSSLPFYKETLKIKLSQI